MLKSLPLNAVFAAAAFAIAGFATPALAQSAPPTGCPAQYEPMQGGLCFKPANGDVVYAEMATPALTYTTADCRKGYELMIDNLCINGKSGDVVFVEPKQGAPVMAAKK
jgi:hypothetical protein